MHLRLLCVLLCPSDESIFVRLSLAGKAIYFRVRAKGTFVVYVTAADCPDTSCVQRLTAILYFGHISRAASFG